MLLSRSNTFTVIYIEMYKNGCLCVYEFALYSLRQTIGLCFFCAWHKRKAFTANVNK